MLIFVACEVLRSTPFTSCSFITPFVRIADHRE